MEFYINNVRLKRQHDDERRSKHQHRLTRFFDSNII